MKDMLLYVVRYGLFAALCGTIIFSILLAMGASVHEVGFWLGPVVFSSWAVGMVPGTLRLLRRSVRPLITMTVVAVLTAGVVSAAMHLHGQSRPSSAESRLVNSMSRDTVQARRIYQGPGYSLIVDGIFGSTIDSLIIVDHTEMFDKRIHVYAESYWDQMNQEVIIPGGPDMNARNIEGLGVPVMSTAVKNTVADTLRLMDAATSLRWAPLPFLDDDRVSLVLVVLVLTLLLTGVWTPLRLTRWPLLNTVMGLGYVRAVVGLPAAVDRIMHVDILAGWMPALAYAELVLIAAGTILLVLGLISVIIPPLSTWRHNMHFEESRS